jgi:pyridoxamine 5'-phosphate oxidase
MNTTRTEVPESQELYLQAIKTLQELIAEAGGEPTAMTLSTVGADGRVSSRVVLLKQIDADGLSFFTNYQSAKGDQLAAHQQAALNFHWKPLREQVQVRVEGIVEKLDAAVSDAYFATRPRMSQIGAWASLQSQEMPGREVFDARVAEIEAKYSGGEVPRPPNWGGYRLRPDLFEFWYGAGFRLHDRQRYELKAGAWRKCLLYP